MSNVAEIENIPDIMIGATWTMEPLQFFQDEAMTISLVLTGIAVKSQIFYPGECTRYPIKVVIGSASNELVFSLDHISTLSLKPGRVQWNVLAELQPGERTPLAEGYINVVERPTLWR